MSTSPPGTPPAVPAARAHLDRSLFHGIAWTGGVKWGTQCLAWLASLIVARLLSPSDYGLFGMASVYLGLITTVSEFGIGTAVVTLRDLSQEQLKQLNALSVALGVAGFAVSLAAAVPLARFFRAPELPLVVVTMSLGFVITSFKSVPSSLLQRELRFKLLSVIDGVRALVLAIAMVLFALAGLRYWTLVLGGLLSAIISTILTLIARRHAFLWPRWESLRHSITISWHILVNRLSWYAYSNADFVVAGRVLGQTQLGAYTVGWNLASTPVQYITSLIGGVTSAFFSAVQSEHAALRRYLLNLTEGLALITFPLSIGLALVAKDLVLLVLSSKWEAVVPPLRLLALYASVRCITPLLPHVLNVTGETRFGMRLSLVCVVTYPTAFYIGSHWGTLGIAAAWMLVDPILNVPVYRRVFQKLQLSTAEYLGALRPAITGSLLMSAAVLLLKPLLASGWPLWVRLAIQVLAGATAYVGALAVFHRGRLQAFYVRLRQARNQ